MRPNLRSARPWRWGSRILLSLAIVAATGVGSAPTAAATGPRLQVSESTDRSPASVLDGAVLSGARTVFIAPAEGVTQVSFWLDQDPSAGPARQTELVAPFDFAGTAESPPSPLRSE